MNLAQRSGGLGKEQKKNPQRMSCRCGGDDGGGDGGLCGGGGGEGVFSLVIFTQNRDVPFSKPC